MEPDAFGEGGSARYSVHSLYLDSKDWRIYRETRNGNFSRFKLRARTYKFDDKTPVFLEVKSRDGEAMQKTRAVLDRAEAIAVLSGAFRTRRRATPSKIFATTSTGTRRTRGSGSPMTARPMSEGIAGSSGSPSTPRCAPLPPQRG